MINTATEEYFDLTYSEEPASYYYLILLVGPSEVKATWYHSTKNLITGFARYPFSGSLKALFQEFKFLGSEFKEVIVLVETNNYLVTPKSLGVEIDAQTFQLTNEFNEDHSVLKTSALVNLNANLTISLPLELDQEIHGLITHSQVLSHIAPSIEHELNLLKQKNSEFGLFCHIHESYIDIRAYKENKLHMANSFFQSGKEDIAYFVLYASEVLEIDPEIVTLVCSGNIAIGDDQWKLLSKYWKKLEVAQPLESVEISSRIQGYSKATFDHLTYALLCAS